MGGGLLVRWDEQDETIAALFEICVGLVGFGFHGHGLRFATHVKLHAQTANRHWKLGLPDTGRRKKKTLCCLTAPVNICGPRSRDTLCVKHYICLSEISALMKVMGCSET